MPLDTLYANINWHIELIATQIGHAENVKGRAKSGYYKIAIFLSASVVEALVHAFLLKKLGREGVILTGEKVTYECHELPKKFHSKEELVICKRKEEKILLSKNPDFALLNKTCLKEKFFTEKIYKRVERVRKARNKIHIQGLDHIDRSYTKNDVEKVSSVINNLIDLYSKS